MNAHIALLKKNKTLLLLSSIQLICYFGAWFSHMAIYSLISKDYLVAPEWVITAVAILTFLPTMILAPFSGVIVDKVPTKPLMITLLFIEIITVLMLLLITSLEWIWLLLILVFIRMGVGSTYFQTEMSLLPKILNANDLKIANEIHSIIWSLSYTAGMGLAGFYVFAFGVKSAFIADAVLFSIGLILLIRLKIPSLIKRKTENAFKMLKDGLIYLKTNRKVLHLILLHACVGFSTYDALVSLLANNIYLKVLAVPLTLGFINSIRALSLTLGSVVLSKFINEKNMHIFFILQGVGIITWALLQFNFYIAFIGVVLAGFFTSTLWAFTYTLLQRETNPAFYGRVVAYNDMFIMGVSVLTSFVIGLLHQNGVALYLITALLGVMFILTAFYFLWFRKNYYKKG
ncbi:MAG: MFS transporter [Campylobacteraceae bacterium]